MDERPNGSDNADGYFTSTIIGRAVSDPESRGRDDPVPRKRSADQGEGGGSLWMPYRPEGRENSSHRMTDEDYRCPEAECVDERVEIGEMKLAVIAKGGLIRLPEAGQIRR